MGLGDSVYKLFCLGCFLFDDFLRDKLTVGDYSRLSLILLMSIEQLVCAVLPPPLSAGVLRAGVS